MNILNVLVDGTRDELSILINAGVEEGAVAFIGPLLDEASRDNTYDD